MKRKLIISVTSLFCMQAYSQDSLTHVRKHELNIGFANLFDQNIFDQLLYYDYGYGYYWGSGYYDGFASYAFSKPQYGFGYKYHLNKIVLRSSLSFNISNHNGEESDPSVTIKPMHYSDSYSRFVLKAGIQAGKDFRKTQFYAAADLFFDYGKMNYDYDYLSNGSREFGVFSKNSFGLSPILGVLFRINDMISISTETSLGISYFMDHSSYTDISSSSYTTTGSFDGKGTEIKINPLGTISINIHL